MSSNPRYLGALVRYRMVVGVDLSEYSEIVVEHALDQAARHPMPELHFLTINESKKPNDELKDELWRRVYPMLETFNEQGADWRARMHVRHGKPEDEIAALASEIVADLIVIGQFGLHKNKLAPRIVASASCPTLVVGMPNDASASPTCPMCASVRDETQGDRWFCAAHSTRQERLGHVATPMTVWTGGALMW
jgi:nucleotide-binding universal stress UspA family protein